MRRREALKRMAYSLTGAAAAALGSTCRHSTTPYSDYNNYSDYSNYSNSYYNYYSVYSAYSDYSPAP